MAEDGGDVTIAGQTAPVDGIAINGTLIINANNIIIRYIRVRGNASGDVITGGYFNKNIIFDHISTSYSSDEIFSVYWLFDITIQWSIISEACSAGHKFGGIWGGERASFHHNLFAHNTDRNPLDPKNAEDGNKTYGPGYTMLEKYMNSLDSF